MVFSYELWVLSYNVFMFHGKRVGAVIVAAGESKRMGGIDKMWTELLGKPVITHTINVFQACELVDQIVTVFHRAKLEDGQKLITQTCAGKPVQSCPGGERRQELSSIRPQPVSCLRLDYYSRRGAPAGDRKYD